MKVLNFYELSGWVHVFGEFGGEHVVVGFRFSLVEAWAGASALWFVDGRGYFAAL